MASAVLIPVSEYLRTSFEHDADFIDGRIEERPMGERDHGLLQRKLLLLLSEPGFDRLFLCLPEVRVKVAEGRFRVPDLCVLSALAPEEQVVETPPLVCIEILSPADTMRRTLVRVRDFLAMGVPEVWVFDPESRTVQVCIGSSITEQSEGLLTVPETDAGIAIEHVFAALDPR